jgi:adenylate cyclase
MFISTFVYILISEIKTNQFYNYNKKQMIRLTKYRNYKNIKLKFILFIFLESIALYVYPNKNVTSKELVFTSSVSKFNLLNSQCYSVTSNSENTIFIGTDIGAMLFDGFGWQIIPSQEPVFDLVAEKDSLYGITGNYLTFGYLKGKNFEKFRKILLSNIRFSELKPPKLFKTGTLFYIFSNPYCYCIDRNKIHMINDEFTDLQLNNNKLYGISRNNILCRITDSTIHKVYKIRHTKDNFRFLTSDKNIVIISDNNILEIDPEQNTLVKEKSVNNINLEFRNIFAFCNNNLFLSPTANYLFSQEINSDYLHQIPIINPFITKPRHCYIDKQNNIWLLYNEGLLMFSKVENSNLFPSGKFSNTLNKDIIGNISNETNLSFIIKRPFYLTTPAFILYFLIAFVILYILIFSWKFRLKRDKDYVEQIIQERTAEILIEKNKTDELLANLLPKDTATELKNTGKASSQKFDMVTVLFSDIQGFTKIAEQLNPEKLIDQLDNFFFHFDSVVEKYNIEKIKTIGDAYMCAGGIPYKNVTNPVEVVLSALEVQDYMRQLKAKDQSFWDLRIGVHTGAVISGVVGHKRLSYDIWGDTVNTASRMESSGEAGKINISGQTFELVKDFFICEYRGKMPVKYKGDIDMYFVKGIRPELSLDLKVIPNRKFFIQLQLLRLHDLEEFIIDRMNQELVTNFFFHSATHTKDVYTQAELIGRAEGISPDEMLLARTAALLLDIGFINDYHNHINHSVNFAREVLPKFKYSTDQIETVCNILFAANTENSNPSLLETILIDSRYNYFGRVDYIEKIQNLTKEIKAWVPSFNPKEFLILQTERMQKFTFFTKTARLLQDVPFSEQVKKLEELIKLS